MSTALIVNPTQLSPVDQGLDTYLRKVNSIPMLSAEQEQTLARRLCQQGDLDAARQLILSHLRFVVSIARNYRGYGLPLADLIQEGNVGLMKAVKHFDPDRSTRLASFAVYWIKAEIKEFILRNWRIVKIATTKAQRKLFFNLRSAKKRLGWLRPTEAETVANTLNVDAELVPEMELRLSGRDIAFDPVPETEGEVTDWSPVDYLADNSSDPLHQLAETDWQEQARDNLAAVFEQLDQRSQTIIERRWLREPKATLQELADELGISAERVRQIESAAIKKLRASVAAV